MRYSSWHSETNLSSAGQSWKWVPLSAPRVSLAQRPACYKDKEHKQERLSLPALVPQTVYRYCGDRALLCWLWRVWLLKSLRVNGGKVINSGLHSISRFVWNFFNPCMETFELKNSTHHKETSWNRDDKTKRQMKVNEFETDKADFKLHD